MTGAQAASGPSIGLVVIGRNEGERLRRCLASIDCAAYPVVYVDSGSTDGSVAMAQAMGARVVELDTAIAFTAARARNAGWHRLVELAPEIDAVQVVDGDCELEAGWLTAAGQFLIENPVAAVVCGRRRERFPEASRYNAMCDAEWNTPVGQARECGGDALMRLSALVAAGGFDPTIVAGEEPELCTRLRAGGWQIWRIDAPMTIHDAAMVRFGQWWVRATRSGYGYAQTFAATRGRAHPLYRRELRRAAFWGGVVPAAAAISAAAGSLLLAGAIACGWAAQGLRLMRRHGFHRGGLLMLAKPAELLGALTWARQQVSASARPRRFAYK
ncbi:MAG TPA: glycosyltransferase family A protein [Novosphingobium sp.]|nr:glycosyltransferase family A protein [Novosphingobium sp.]